MYLMSTSYPEETNGAGHTAELVRQRKNASISPEERAAQRAKAAARVKLYRQRKHASMSAEERAAQKAKKAAADKIYRQRKNASMSAEERAAQKAKKMLRQGFTVNARLSR